MRNTLLKERPKAGWGAPSAWGERGTAGAVARKPARTTPPAPARGAVVRIYRPAGSVTQAGHANARHCVLEFGPASPPEVAPLMGWNASRDVRQQVQLRFSTREQAVAFAERRGWTYAMAEPREVRRRPKSYADNFRWRPGGAKGAGS